MATDRADNIYLTSYFSGTARFGDTALTGAGALDIFIAGNTEWHLELIAPD